MKQSGITQAEVAAAAGCSQSMVNRVLSREIKPDASTMAEAIWAVIERAVVAPERRRLA